MQRLTVTLDDDLVAELDRFMEGHNYENRSEAFRDLVRAGLRSVSDEVRGSKECVGAMVYVYDHHVRELAKRLTTAHHDHHDLSVATLHVHLNHTSCMEVAIVRGETSDVQAFSANIFAERGVRHGRLVVVPGEIGQNEHAHDGARAKPHRHVRVR